MVLTDDAATVDHIAELGRFFTVLIALALIGLIVLALWARLVWLASMMVRPWYLHKLHQQGVEEWSLHTHSVEYHQALVERRQQEDDRYLLDAEINALIDSMLEGAVNA